MKIQTVLNSYTHGWTNIPMFVQSEIYDIWKFLKHIIGVVSKHCDGVSKRGAAPLLFIFPFPRGEGEQGPPAIVPKGRRAGDGASTTEQGAGSHAW